MASPLSATPGGVPGGWAPSSAAAAATTSPPRRPPSSLAEQLSPGESLEQRRSTQQQPRSRAGTPSLVFGPIGAHRSAAARQRSSSPASGGSARGTGSGDSELAAGGSGARHSSGLHSSSPSYASARSHLGDAPQASGTPRLVVDTTSPVPAHATPRTGDEARAMFAEPEAEEESIDTRSASMVGQLVDDEEDAEQPPPVRRPASGASMRSGQEASSPRVDGNGVAYPFAGGASYTQPLRSPSLGTAQSPFLSLPGGAAGLAGGLLSPTAATFGLGGSGASSTGATAATAGSSTPTFSPFGSPPRERPLTPGSMHSGTGGHHNGGVPRSASGLSSAARHASNTPRAPSVDGASGFGSERGAHAPSSAADASLRASPLFNDVLERLLRLEVGLKDVNRHIGGLSRNVSLLLDRTKHLGGAQRGGLPADVHSAAHGSAQVQDEVRALSAQLNTLAGSVAQLFTSQGAPPPQVLPPRSQAGMNGTPHVGAMQQQLAGLGLGAPSSGTPQLGGNILTPQLGTFPGTPNLGGRAGALSPYERSASPRTGSGGFVHAPLDRGLSPRPGASPAPSQNRLSWGAGAPQQVQQSLTGVAKEHLAPDARRWAAMNAAAAGGNFSPALGGPNRRESSGTPHMRTGTPEVDSTGRFAGAGQVMSGGAMGPPDPSVVVTKWEHLNLHGDLLRSILKYGLGPPNKIQQRALPFLLRGSDIIAQAPPTQERIASYVIPALQQILNVLRGEPVPPGGALRGPIVLIISTTVDQATQAQRMSLGLGAALGVRVHIAAAGSIDVGQEAANLVQSQPHLVVGTPQKMNDLFTYLANRGAISLADVRLVILDEADQLIARNLADYVSTLLRLLPQPRGNASREPLLSPGLPQSSGPGRPFSPFDGDKPASLDRQTAIFSNTVPQDVLNFAQSIHLRESVRVLVRREGGGGALQATTTYGGAGASGFSSSPSIGSGTMGLGNNHGSQTPQLGQLQHPAQQQHTPQLGSYGSAPPGAPSNALGATPTINNANPLADPMLAPLRGLRQYYLYVAVSTGPAAGPPMGYGGPNAHANEMKLDVITDLLEDIDFNQAVVYVASAAALEAVTYKLASKGVEAMSLSKEMASTTRQQVLSAFRSAYGGVSAYQQASHAVVGGPGGGGARSAGRKALVVHDVALAAREVHQVPLVVFYDLPRSVEEYKEKIACAAATSGAGRPSVCINVVTGSGGPRGDIEMLRSLELHLGCKMAELPMHLGQLLNF